MFYSAKDIGDAFDCWLMNLFFQKQWMFKSRDILVGYLREYQPESNGQKKERLIESYYQTALYWG